jgi:L-alanine-DL-glutamate epimerase-like enolase superfamily enzyme
MPTTIRNISYENLDIPLTSPFGIAGGAQDIARNLLVTIELADGTRGYGEAAPFPAFNGETQDLARAAVDAGRNVIEGADAREWRRLAGAIRNAVGPIGSAQCALETAILDALTRRVGVPLWGFFGGVSRSLETDMTIPTGSVEQARADAQAIINRGIRTIKIKVGSGDLSLDIERVTAIHDIAPSAKLLLDGNGGFTADGALQYAAALHERNIHPVLFEQPVAGDDWEGLRQVTQWGGIPVAADESVCSSADALRVSLERAAQVVNIKLMKCGIVEALDIAALCRAARIRLMIGGMVESILAMTTSACFAAGQGGFHYVDLDTPMFMAENPFDGGFVQTGGDLDLSGISAGHGVTPKARA